MKTEVQPQKTKRAYAFEMWMKSPMPMVTLTKTFDVSRIYKIAKRKKLKFNMLLCWCIGKAACVFGPQKGADPEAVRVLDARARRFAEVSAKHFGYDRSEVEGAGAAGGLGYAFLQYLNADCRPGIQLLLEAVRFGELVKGADLVFTGEGSADRQTLMGKLPSGVLEQSGGVPVCLVAGRIKDREQLLQAGFARVECINPPGIALEEALRKEVAMRNIRETVVRVLQTESR